MSIRQAAGVLGIGETVIRRWVRIGCVKLYRPPGTWPKVELAECERELRSHRVLPKGAAEAEHAAQRVAEMAAVVARRSAEGGRTR